MARELEGNWTRFTPHYIVWVCPESYRQSDECQSQCIHNGRYCTPDPDGDLEAGYSGRDIVQVCHACPPGLSVPHVSAVLFSEYAHLSDQCRRELRTLEYGARAAELDRKLHAKGGLR